MTQGAGPRKGPRRVSALAAALQRGEKHPWYPREGEKHVPAKRAVVILKARGMRTRDVAVVVGMTERSVNRWLQDGLADEVARILEEGTAEARDYIRANALPIAERLVALTRRAGKEHGPRVKACVEGLAMVGITRKTVVEHVRIDPLEEASEEELDEMIRAEVEPEIRAKVERELRERGWQPPTPTKTL
jgi:predicted transcriptional regulator